MVNYSFSIITVSFNQKKYIEFNIESVLNQKYDNLEHIIIDAGSTDGTLDTIKKYKHLNFSSRPDRGQSHGLNKGFRKAKGDIIGWVNSDDMLYEGAIKNVNSFFNKNPNAIAVVGNKVIIDDQNKILRIEKSRVYDYNFLLNEAKGIHQPSTFFRREVFDKIGYIDEGYNYAMDREFFIRISTIDKIYSLDKELAYFRLQPESKTSKGVYNFAKELFMIRLKYRGRFLGRGNLDSIYIIATEPLRRIKFLRNIIRKLKGFDKID